MEDKVLDYCDILLRKEDVALLDGPFWLNDQIIGFFFQYLPLEKYTNIQGKITLVSGTVSFLLSHVNEQDAFSTIEKLGISSNEAALFAVNNNPHVQQAGGGSHWSLLLYLSRTKKFFHFDSIAESNRNTALTLANIVSRGMGEDTVNFVDVDSPQQSDGWMCGYFTIQIADTICDLLSINKLDDYELMLRCIEFDVDKKLPTLQADLKALIKKLACRNGKKSQT